MLPDLLTIEEAAKRLGVPRTALRAAADRHGFTVRVGRAIRVDANQLGDLIELCRDRAKERVSSTAQTEASTSSATASTECQQALASAAKLSKPLRCTSHNETGPPAQLHRIG